MELIAKALVWVGVPMFVIYYGALVFLTLKGKSDIIDQTIRFTARRDAQRCAENKLFAFAYSWTGFIVLVLATILESWYIYEYAGYNYGSVNAVLSAVGLVSIYRYLRTVQAYRHSINYYPL